MQNIDVIPFNTVRDYIRKPIDKIFEEQIHQNTLYLVGRNHFTEIPINTIHLQITDVVMNLNDNRES